MQYEGVIYHKETLESQYNLIKKEMDEIQSKLKPLEEKMKTLRFIEHFGLKSYFNIDRVQNIKITNSYDYVSAAEYCGSGEGEFNFSYEYCNSKNKNKIKTNEVKFSLKYSSQQSYENRYNPYIECQTSVNVTNTNDKYYIDKDNRGIPVQFFVNEEEPEEESWGYLLSKIIQDIEYKGVLEFIDFN